MANMRSQKPDIKVFLDGEKGFIYQNLKLRFAEVKRIDVENKRESEYIDCAIFIFDDANLWNSNEDCTLSIELKIEKLRVLAEKSGRVILLGRSAETLSLVINDYFPHYANLDAVFMPNIFGKWAEPIPENPISLLCYEVLYGENDGSAILLNEEPHIESLYIDDLADLIINSILGSANLPKELPKEEIYLPDVLMILRDFKSSRSTLTLPAVGSGFLHNLYSTFISYYGKKQFSYSIPAHRDVRGNFIELVKTKECGQFSCLTAGPGITRGQHYHHSKTEKFLLVKGRAKFLFRNLLTDEKHELIVSAERPEVVETIPGWVHNITNIGDEDIIVLLWANETFDPERPDTYTSEI